MTAQESQVPRILTDSSSGSPPPILKVERDDDDVVDDDDDDDMDDDNDDDYDVYIILATLSLCIWKKGKALSADYVKIAVCQSVSIILHAGAENYPAKWQWR